MSFLIFKNAAEIAKLRSFAISILDAIIEYKTLPFLSRY
jgi:hypothetical protein